MITKPYDFNIPEIHKEIIDTDKNFIFLFGGRGGCKSNSIAELLLALSFTPDSPILCTREIQKSISESVYVLLENKIKEKKIGGYFNIKKTYIENRMTGNDFAFAGLREHTVDSIKSYEKRKFCWCFIPGTLIDGKKIETLKKGDIVSSCNHKTNKVEYKKVLNTFENKAPEEFIQLTLKGLDPMICTKEHPVYVKGKGYVQASLITKGDIVYAKEERLSRIYELFRWLRRKHTNKQYWKTKSVYKKWWGLLQGLQKENSIKSYESKKPYGQSRIKTKDDCLFKRDGAQTVSIRREWERFYKSTKSFIRTIRAWVVARTCYYNWRKKKVVPLSNKLQNRFGKCILQVSNRVRWWRSFRRSFKTGRFKESGVLEEHRVESVEIKKQRDIKQYKNSDGNNYVYNIEVEVNNNYFANRVLVHNCEEAQSVSKRSLDILIPTVIRNKDFKLLFSYNRFLDNDPVHNLTKIYDCLKIKSTIYDNPFINDEMLAEAERMKEQNYNDWMHIYDGEPINQTDKAILSRESIQLAMSRAANDEGQIEIGADIARFGVDRTTIYKRKGWKVIDFEDYEKKDNVEIADFIEKMADDDKKIMIKIDATGVGGGVADILRSRGYKNIVDINFGASAKDKDKYPNLISEAWFEFSDIIDKVEIPNDEELKHELATREWKMDSKGRRIVESKDDYKKRGNRSPDKADGLLICFYEPPNNKPYYAFT